MIGVNRQRLSAWPELLNREIAVSHNEPFVYGVHDCTQLVIRCEKAMYGETLFPEFDCSYDSLRKGLGIALKQGYKSMFEMAGSRMQEVDISQAKRGDCVGHMTEDGESLGIYAGFNGFYCVAAEGGVLLSPTSDIVKIWSL